MSLQFGGQAVRALLLLLRLGGWQLLDEKVEMFGLFSSGSARTSTSHSRTGLPNDPLATCPPGRLANALARPTSAAMLRSRTLNHWLNRMTC